MVPGKETGKVGTARERILAVLGKARKPLTINEVEMATGLHHTTVATRLPRMRAEGVVHIKAWHRARGHSGRLAARYAAGPGKDARKPGWSRRQKRATDRAYWHRNRARLLVKRRIKSGIAAPASPWAALA